MGGEPNKRTKKKTTKNVPSNITLFASYFGIKEFNYFTGKRTGIKIFIFFLKCVRANSNHIRSAYFHPHPQTFLLPIFSTFIYIELFCDFV